MPICHSLTKTGKNVGIELQKGSFVIFIRKIDFLLRRSPVNLLRRSPVNLLRKKHWVNVNNIFKKKYVKICTSIKKEDGLVENKLWLYLILKPVRKRVVVSLERNCFR